MAATGLMFIMIWLSASLARADDLHLRLPATPDGEQKYYYDLLSDVMRTAGHPVSIELVSDIPQVRFPAALESGDIDAHYFFQTSRRDKMFLAVPTPLTDGLFGKRVLFIPKGDQPLYDHVASLTDFRNLGKVAAAGRGWVDVRAWHATNLPVYEHHRNWQDLYDMVASRRRDVDFMPRGVNEISAEIDAHPDLEVERNLLLTYDMDVIFYVSRKRPDLASLITEALKQAAIDGVISQHAQANWAGDIQALGVAHRVVIGLQNPLQTSPSNPTP